MPELLVYTPFLMGYQKFQNTLKRRSSRCVGSTWPGGGRLAVIGPLRGGGDASAADLSCFSAVMRCASIYRPFRWYEVLVFL